MAAFKKIMVLVLLLYSVCFQAQNKTSGLVQLDANMSLQLDLDTANSKVYLTLSGPSDRWFALGFNSLTMGTSLANSIDVDCVVMTSASTLSDSYIHARSTPMVDAQNNWILTANTVSNSIRTIKAYRPFVSSDSSDFNFKKDLTTLNVIWSYSYSQDNYSLKGHGDNYGRLALSFSNLDTAQNQFTSYNLEMYPNPVNDNLTIVPHISSAAEIDIAVYNSNYQMVFNKIFSTATAKEIKIPFTNLPEGIYFIKSKIESFESFKKIIVSK